MNQRNQERMAAINQRKQDRLEAINDRKQARLEAINDRKQERLEAIYDRKQERLEAINQRKEERLARINQRNPERRATINQRSQEQSVSPTDSDGCFYLSLAREFIASLMWPNTIFDTRFDRCYCPSCYKYNWDNVLQAGGGLYVIPRGWVRLGVQVDSVAAELNDIWNCWQVTYHGTSVEAAISIIKSRQFSIPGDQLLDGSFLAIRPGHIPRKRHIYSSPTIAYSSHPVYCPVYDFTSNTNERYRVKIVLECRQNPNLMQIQGETVRSGSTRICPYIPNDKIEYFTEARASLVAYGLLLQFEQCS